MEQQVNVASAKYNRIEQLCLQTYAYLTII
jgi:hypothetical protein